MGHSWSSFEATHCLIDRKTGQRMNETTPVTKAARTFFLYKTPLGHLLMKLPLTWWLLTWEHRRIAKFANSPDSKKKIPGFIKSFNIPTDDSVRPVEDFKTLQDFFTRELKEGARPLAQPDNPNVAVHCGDSRVVVFSSVSEAKRLWIKGKHFNIPALIGPGYSREEWREAAVVVNRLSPADCHRLHAPVTGRVVRINRMGTRFMSSLWVAVHSALDVMIENERLVMEFDSDAFGPVIMVMIGASDIGTCQPLVKEGQRVRKGDEVGVFEFGGSIVVTAFKPGSIDFDDDLVRHSANDCETRCLIGQSLGRATRGGAGAPAGVRAQQ